MIPNRGVFQPPITPSRLETGLGDWKPPAGSNPGRGAHDLATPVAAFPLLGAGGLSGLFGGGREMCSSLVL
jgi:hypothetical protein